MIHPLGCSQGAPGRLGFPVSADLRTRYGRWPEFLVAEALQRPAPSSPPCIVSTTPSPLPSIPNPWFFMSPIQLWSADPKLKHYKRRFEFLVHGCDPKFLLARVCLLEAVMNYCVETFSGHEDSKHVYSDGFVQICSPCSIF